MLLQRKPIQGDQHLGMLKAVYLKTRIIYRITNTRDSPHHGTPKSDYIKADREALRVLVRQKIVVVE